ncbi:hypothetical protein P153DRAFT_195050 [Dothidotthia symphoricarpi CBS 119687]|uniref:Uncharacterized protein n=1 Tax=Dothidotthia symphoricarpi CBS 119687 TaxID=1392245 RepID=A0A6A6AKM0_9PLEO|nr:uncharacterized protein P153DRAFT_195050 [Dothidotthia symphoricarpi CBS 119687]KAF2131417.1 hypothetical protein P153DRAFT_195050 [Dothidotthia symphoricarpi CBS 119687]
MSARVAQECRSCLPRRSGALSKPTDFHRLHWLPSIQRVFSSEFVVRRSLPRYSLTKLLNTNHNSTVLVQKWQLETYENSQVEATSCSSKQVLPISALFSEDILMFLRELTVAYVVSTGHYPISRPYYFWRWYNYVRLPLLSMLFVAVLRVDTTPKAAGRKDMQLWRSPHAQKCFQP